MLSWQVYHSARFCSTKDCTVAAVLARWLAEHRTIKQTLLATERMEVSFAWRLRSVLTHLGTKAHAPHYLQEKNACTFRMHRGKYSCSRFPVQLVQVYFDTDMHSKSISLVPAARCGSEGAEEKGEEDRQPEHPGGAATSEVIFFPRLSSLTISHSTRPLL